MAASASSPSSHPGPSRPGRRLRPARWSGLPAAELKKPRLIRVAVPRATWVKLEPLWLGGILLLLGNTRAAHRDEKTHLTETARQTVTAHVTGDEREPSADQPPRGPGAAISHELNPLQHTIHQRLRERDWSYGEVARRGGLPRSTVYTLAMTRNLARPPRPATLDGLAKGLELCRSLRSAPPPPSPPDSITTTRSPPNRSTLVTANGNSSSPASTSSPLRTGGTWPRSSNRSGRSRPGRGQKSGREKIADPSTAGTLPLEPANHSYLGHCRTRPGQHPGPR